MGIGEWAALGAAFFWTVSSLLWSKINLTALGLNFSKNAVGSTILLIHLTLFALITGQAVVRADSTAWGWLAMSALIGIVLGDTCYFRCIQILGARQALMLATTAPLFAAALGWRYLQESITLWMILGISLTVTGLITVVAGRKRAIESPGLLPGSRYLGVLFGILAAVCQAVGAVFSKIGMEKGCDALEATFIRLFVSLIVTLVIVLGQGRLHVIAGRVCKADVLKFLVPATAVGTWLGIWCSQVSFKMTDVSVATTLQATSPLFAIPILYFFLGLRTTLSAFLGTVLAIVGVYLVVTGHG